jgi:drug/metabolite transporter (DMT)-like permease
VLCLVSAVGFGMAAVFAKESYRAGAGVSMMLAVRFALAATIFWLVVARRRPPFPARRVLLTVVALGGLGYALQALFYFGALARINASLTGLLLYLYPALVTVLAVVLRRERPDRRRVAALTCSAAGLLLILGAGSSAESAGVGVALALGSACAYALYLTVADGLPADLDLFLLSAVVCSAASVTLGVASLATGALHAPARPIGWLWIAALAAFSTVLPIATLLAGIRLVGAPTAAILSCAEPAVTVVTTALLYGERLTAGQVVGGIVVLAAVAIPQINRRPSAGPPSAGMPRSGPESRSP